MLKKETTTKILDIIMTSFISILLIYTSSTFMFTIFFVLIPFIVIIVKYGYKEFLLSFLLSVVFSALFIDKLSIIYLYSYIFILSIVIGAMISKRKKLSSIILVSTISSLLFIITLLLIEYYINNINLLEVLKSDIDKILLSMEKVLKDDLSFNVEQTLDYINTFRYIFDYIFSIIPALTIVSSFIVAVTNLFGSILILNKTDSNIKYNMHLSKFNFGEKVKQIVFTFAISLIILHITNLKSKEMIINNLSFILMFILAINGSMICYYFLENRFNKIFAIILILLLIFLLQGYSLIAILGMVDIVINLRKNTNFRKREDDKKLF